MLMITGDTHIPIDIHKLNVANFPLQSQLTKDDYLIICGDFGGVWNGGNEEKYWLDWLDNKNFTTLFVDGNHENFDLLNKYEVSSLFGGKVHQIKNSIYHLMRGQVFTIENKKIFTLGGAKSHDKESRKDGKSWWKEEMPSHSELFEALKNLRKVNYEIDYIITHCAPTSIVKYISSYYEADDLTNFLEKNILLNVQFSKWFFGHYHEDFTYDKFRGLYDKIEVLQ